MSGNLIDLRRRIGSVRNTQKITRAMKTVSAAKLRRSVQDLNRNRPYMEKLAYLLGKLGSGIHDLNLPFMEQRDKGDVMVIVLSSDKGLCGSFNSNILKRAEQYHRQLTEEGEEVELILIGQKANKYFSVREYPIKQAYTDLMSKLTYTGSLELAHFLQDIYKNEPIKRIDFVYAQFVSASKQEINIKQMFPISSEWQGEDGDDTEYILEPSAAELFKAILPKYINSLVYRMLLESSASEHSARMIAMDMATRNADDMIKELTLTLNKLRQALITKELLEIITATEALKH